MFPFKNRALYRSSLFSEYYYVFNSVVKSTNKQLKNNKFDRNIYL